MSDPEKQEVPATPRRDPAALSTEYHKAHKQVMLWATILLIWELIGVDLSKAKDAGGNIGPIVTALKSPQAVPWVLLGLVLYFLFKCSVEWAQCHVDRRRLRFARVDFISAWIVSLSAIVLYAGQTISRIQLANAIQGSVRFNSVLRGVALGLSLPLTALLLRLVFARKKRWLLVIRLIAFLVMLSGFVLMTWERSMVLVYFLTALILGVIGGGFTIMLFLRKVVEPNVPKN